MLLGWTSHLLAGVQRILDKYQTRETDEIFTPRRNMYLWGIGYSAASVDCTAAAVFPYVAWLTVVGEGAFKATGAWMMMFAGIGLLVYLTQPEIVASLI